MTDIVSVKVENPRYDTFTYEDEDGKIYVPEKTDEVEYRRFPLYFIWVVNSLNHEELHALIHRFIGFDAMVELDNLPHDDMARGCIFAL